MSHFKALVCAFRFLGKIQNAQTTIPTPRGLEEGWDERQHFLEAVCICGHGACGGVDTLTRLNSAHLNRRAKYRHRPPPSVFISENASRLQKRERNASKMLLLPQCHSRAPSGAACARVGVSQSRGWARVTLERMCRGNRSG